MWAYFTHYHSFPLGLAVQGVLFLVLIATVLHILDRQGDFVARTDFIWKAKLKVEQEEVETMRGINKVNLLRRVHAMRMRARPRPTPFMCAILIACRSPHIDNYLIITRLVPILHASHAPRHRVM